MNCENTQWFLSALRSSEELRLGTGGWGLWCLSVGAEEGKSECSSSLFSFLFLLFYRCCRSCFSLQKGGQCAFKTSRLSGDREGTVISVHREKQSEQLWATEKQQKCRGERERERMTGESCFKGDWGRAREGERTWGLWPFNCSCSWVFVQQYAAGLSVPRSCSCVSTAPGESLEN